jgi:hypothetical protein
MFRIRVGSEQLILWIRWIRTIESLDPNPGRQKRIKKESQLFKSCMFFWLLKSSQSMRVLQGGLTRDIVQYFNNKKQYLNEMLDLRNRVILDPKNLSPDTSNMDKKQW